MKQWIRRLTAMILAVCMCMSFACAEVWAAESETAQADESAVPVSEQTTDAPEAEEDSAEEAEKVFSDNEESKAVGEVAQPEEGEENTGNVVSADSVCSKPEKLEPQEELSAQATVASGTCGDNLTWRLDGDSGTLTISGTGTMTDYDYTSDVPWYNQRSKIHQVHIGSGVKSIGKYAFYHCENLTDVTIPSSVTGIGSFAFQACVRLTSVTIPSGVKTIGSYAFDCCTSLTSAAILGHVKSIEVYTFNSCTSLTSVTMPTSVKTISWWAFRNCTGLTSVTIPSSVKYIEGYSFAGARKLKSVFFKGNAPSINDYAFSEDNLTAYYPSHNKTWTKSKKKQYGGKIKWIERFNVPNMELKSLTTPQKGWIKVTWKAAKSISGYRLQISESGNFKNGKQKTVNLSSKVKEVTMSGLKSGKTYYARIRAYKKNGSKITYGEWSKVKSVKVK